MIVRTRVAGVARPSAEKVGVGLPQIAQGVALAPPVADLARDHQRLLVVADRLLHLPQEVVGCSQAAQTIALAAPVADGTPLEVIR